MAIGRDEDANVACLDQLLAKLLLEDPVLVGPADEDDAGTPSAAAEALADEINARTAGWAYAIRDFQGDSLRLPMVALFTEGTS